MTNYIRTMTGTETLWPLWVQANQATCAVCSTDTWIVWNQSATTTNSITVDPWPLWQASTQTGGSGSGTVLQSTQSTESIRAQLRAAEDRLRRHNEANAAYLKAEGERAAARERAERLLMDVLTDQQKAELAGHGYFTVEPKQPVLIGERYHYRIRRGRSRNIERMSSGGRLLETLCAHPIEHVPDADTMLAQKLWIETREADLLRIANHS